MPWIARFADGPLAGGEEDRNMMGPFEQRLTFAFIPSFGGEERWCLIGIDDDIPDPAWPQQITYRTADELDPWEGELEENVATFRLESDA